MTTLTLIAEPFPDWEATLHAAAAQDLAEAIAETAPRSCATRILFARDTKTPQFTSPRIRVEQLPIKAQLLPLLWQNRQTARPLDGELVHALTPMMPLRARKEADGSQSSVMIPHTVPWDAPALFRTSLTRLYRAYVRRAAKLADILFVPTHATAAAIQRHFTHELPVQILPLAVPSALREPNDARERRSSFGLPDQYTVTTAWPGTHGRLEWVFDALRADPSLPPVVVFDALNPATLLDHTPHDTASSETRDQIPSDLTHRVHLFCSHTVSDIGSVLSGAQLLLQPQSFSDTGYLLLAALAAGVPVLHAGQAATAEIALDAGVCAESSPEFTAQLSKIFHETHARDRLSVLAEDRGHGFHWHSTAWQLWETHANL